MKKLILLSGAILLFGALASAKSATSSTRSSRVVNNIKDVRTVYVRKIEGDREFARRLTNEIKSCGLCFVDNAKNADALFSARGDYQDGAFYGAMKFVNRSGKRCGRRVRRDQKAAITWRIRVWPTNCAPL